MPTENQKIFEAYNTMGTQTRSGTPGVLSYDDNKNSFAPKGGLPMNEPGASKLQYPSSDEEHAECDDVVQHLEQAAELCHKPEIKKEIRQIISKLS